MKEKGFFSGVKNVASQCFCWVKLCGKNWKILNCFTTFQGLFSISFCLEMCFIFERKKFLTNCSSHIAISHSIQALQEGVSEANPEREREQHMWIFISFYDYCYNILKLLKFDILPSRIDASNFRKCILKIWISIKLWRGRFSI